MHIIDEFIILANLVYYQSIKIVPFWVGGVITGAFLTSFARQKINDYITRLASKGGFLGVHATGSILGIASPICMYGTIPLIASLGQQGLPHSLLAAFMVSSILLNPNLFIFSFALGVPAALLRLAFSLLAGILAGYLVKKFFVGKPFFKIDTYKSGSFNCNSSSKSRNFYSAAIRTIWVTFPYLLAGLVLSAIYQRYFPQEVLVKFLGADNGFGVLMAASLGVPIYVCGGGTIPLMKTWMECGMSMGAAVAFMITGPATKITNLSAVKSLLGTKNFILYISFCMIFAMVAGWLINFVLSL